MNWRTKAACAGTNLDMWVTPPQKPGSDGPELVATARKALALCAGCPVLADCAADADRHPVVGLIRAGRAYDLDGRQAACCDHCGQVIVGRNGQLARWCSESCNRAGWYAASKGNAPAAAEAREPAPKPPTLKQQTTVDRRARVAKMSQTMTAPEIADALGMTVSHVYADRAAWAKQQQVAA